MLEENGTYELINEAELPERAELLTSRFIFSTKRSGKRKARLVAGGHIQTRDLFHDDSSRTMSENTLNLFLAHDVQKDYWLTSIDFDGAYLNAHLPEAVFMRIPAGFQEVR